MSSKKPISVISASAGTGKTFRLMNILHEEISSGHVLPEKVMAVTYMRKAAVELSQRVRQKLLSEGLPELAQRMEAARIGTLHSVSTKVLAQFAYETGSSPRQRPIQPDESDAIFREVLAAEISDRDFALFQEIGGRMGLSADSFVKAAKSLVDLARQNGLDADSLEGFAAENIAFVDRVFPKGGSADPDAALMEALERYVARHRDPPDDKQNTGTVHRLVKDCQSKGQGAELSWVDWLALAQAKPAKMSEKEFSELIEAASAYASHPKLRQDLSAVIGAVHRVASQALNRFSERKKELGVVDFKDMERDMLELLGREEVRQRLSEDVDLLLVDEFQDTNPVQLAIYSKLSTICKKTVWVGDPKQSILSVSGADAVLMNAVIEQIGGKSTDVLGENWRSRKELVEFTSELFGKVFERDGVPAERVKVTPRVKFSSNLSALSVWELEGKNAGLRDAALASEVKDVLRSGVQVIDRGTGKPRTIRPSDLAILCLSNDRCAAVADALRAYEVEASCPMGTLSGQPEIRMALSAFRYLADSGDTVGAAELTLLLGKNANEWLSLALTEGVEVSAWSEAVAKLEQARERSLEKTPRELLESAIAIVGIESIAERLAQGKDRLTNLSALRTLVSGYEERCEQALEPCTPSGFLDFFGELAQEGKDTLPAFSRPDAVDVLTFHGSKGLEWPIVILSGLDSGEPDAELFGTRVVGRDAATFDVNEPLTGRALRYLPWPFGRKEKAEAVQTRQSSDPEFERVREEKQAEARRLLYVAMTRARESLVFAWKKGFTGDDCRLNCLVDEKGKPVLGLPGAKQADFKIGKRQFGCEQKCVSAKEVEELPEAKQKVLPSASALGAEARLPLFISPTAFDHEPPVAEALRKAIVNPVKLAEKLDLGGRLQMKLRDTKRIEDGTLGDLIHLFFAADDPAAPRAERLSLASDIIGRWNCADMLDAEELVHASDRLTKAVQTRWPDGRIEKEREVLARISAEGWFTLLHGTADYLVRARAENAVIDHKTALLAEGGFETRVRAHAGQLAAYEHALAQAEAKPVSLWVHFPLSGVLCRLAREE